MDKRFRRESNLSSSSKRISVENSGSGSQENRSDSKSSFVSYFLDSYKKIKKTHAVRDTILLASALFCILLAVSWTLPRVFSFQFDTTSILKLLNFESPSDADPGEEQEGDIDILILGRGGRENDAPDLTDSIIVGHYNKSQDSFVTVSIPRDLLIQSKILGRVKINEVYPGVKRSLGEEAAMIHLMEIVSQITGKNIRMYSMIDFSGFRTLIDAV